MFDLTTFTPYKQGLYITGLGLLCMAGGKVLQLLNITATNPEKIWIWAITFGLFFSVANCVFSLNTKDSSEKYWGQSMLAFILAMFLLVGAAYLLSGIGLEEGSAFRWLLIVVVIGHLVFSSIVRLMKGIVDFAQKEEWNAPNKKKRKRK